MKPKIKCWHGEWVVDMGRIAGRRVIKRATSKRDAQQIATEESSNHRNLGQEGLSLPAETIREAAKCIRRLKEVFPDKRPFLWEIANFYIRMKGPDAGNITVAQVCKAFLESQVARDLRPQSVRTSRLEAERLTAKYGPREIRLIPETELREWVKTITKDVAAATGNRHIRYLSGIWTFAKKRRWVDENPFDGIERPRETPKMPSYMPASMVERVLRLLEAQEPALVLPVALGFFAGIRPTEILRMVPEDIKPDQGIITIRPEAAKIRSARHVRIQPNLLTWLMKYRRLDKICPEYYSFRRRLRSVLDGILWTPDVARHTFATMHLAAFEDAAKTAFEMGHTRGVTLLYTNYRGLATREEALSFWALKPAGVVAENSEKVTAQQ